MSAAIPLIRNGHATRMTAITTKPITYIINQADKRPPDLQFITPLISRQNIRYNVLAIQQVFQYQLILSQSILSNTDR